MTPVLTTVVVIEAICVVLVWRAASATQGGALGAMFVAAAFLFNGLADVVKEGFAVAVPEQDLPFIVSQQALERWRIAAMLGIVVFTITYVGCATVFRRGAGQPPAMPPRLTRFSWKVLLVCALPLWAVAVRGSAQSTADDYWRTGIANQFLLLVFVLAVVDYSLRRGGSTKHILLALVVASVLTVLIGQRLEVLAVVVLSLGALWWYGARLPRSALLAGGGVVLVLTMILTVARDEVGRERLTGSTPVSERLAAMGEALGDLANPTQVGAVAADFAQRFDGNRFPALVLQTQDQTTWRPGLDGLGIAFNLAVPSFLNPVKTNSPIEERSEKEMLNQGYGLRIKEDFLPTVFGSAVAQTGIDSLLAVLAVLGVGLAALDRWLAGRRSDLRLLVGLGFGIAIIYFERDLGNWVLVLRGVIPLAVLVILVSMAQAVVERSHAGPIPLSSRK